jgi:phosphatidylserine/phosphatidylglycerophosphate/cardiolipin synthase-like enzyme
MKDEELYNWLYNKLTDEEGVTPSDAKERFGESGFKYAETFLDIWESKSLVEYDDGHYIATDKEALQNEINSEATEEEEEEPTEREHITDSETKVDNLIAVSVPTEYRRAFENSVVESSNLDVIYLSDAIEDIINQSDEELRLSVPFLELSGFNRFRSVFVEAARDDINLKILTRGIMNPTPFESGRHSDMKALLEIIEWYKSNTSTGEVRVSDFQENLHTSDSNGSRETLNASVHLKSIIADNKVAYIGSGEIRGNSLYQNFEGGNITRVSEEVDFWKNSFDFFFEKGEEVTREFLRNLLCLIDIRK